MKKNNDITLNRAWNHIDTIMAGGMFQIVADDGSMVAVTGLEARRMGFSTDCFTGFDGRGIYGTAFLSMEQQPSYVKWRIEELITMRAIIISTSYPVGRLLVNENSDLVRIPDEEQKELYWDARNRKPRGRNSRNNKLGLNGANSYTWSKSRNQGHTTLPEKAVDSKGWSSKKEAERNQGVAVKAGKRIKSSGHHADKKRSLFSASAAKKTERKMKQVNAVDLKGLNKKLQAEQEKKAKELDRLNNGGKDIDNEAVDALFAPAQKKE